MASQVRTRDARLSVLAQAKPVIIDSTESMNPYDSKSNEQKLEFALAKLENYQSSQESTIFKSKTASDANNSSAIDSKLRTSEMVFTNLKQTSGAASNAYSSTQPWSGLPLAKRAPLTEDEGVMRRQNAANQMRQAAVIAASVGQQQKRLSATERLAMTAKRPAQQAASAVAGEPQSAPAGQAPTLETLLAVQRQLREHTRQHLATEPSSPDGPTTRRPSKPLPPSPPKSPLEKALEIYEKDLPPLPPAGDSSSGDDEYSSNSSSSSSQLNSLDSHQSSPATSLVSVPPPPVSHYLERCDERLPGPIIPVAPAPIPAQPLGVPSKFQSGANLVGRLNPDKQPQPTSSGHDEPDCAGFRFPTPPPLELLLGCDEQMEEEQPERKITKPSEMTVASDSSQDDDEDEEEDEEEDEDDDFQCRIPTPPAHKANPMASFAPHTLEEASAHFGRFSDALNMAAAAAAAAPMGLQPPPSFRQPQLTVHIGGSTHGTGLLHNHEELMTMVPASSSSPASSSDGDGQSQSSNASSSTSGVHSSIESPSIVVPPGSSAFKLDALDFGRTSLTGPKPRHALLGNGHPARPPHQVAPLGTGSQSASNTVIKPALKQKKSVSFSDKVELVACADEQPGQHWPNPLLARVLASRQA